MHYPCIARIASEGIFDDSVKQLGFGDAAVFFFVKIMFHEDFLDPGIDRKCINMMETEEADAVRYLFTDSIKAGEIIYGLFIVLGGQKIQVQASFQCVLTEPVDIFCPVSQLQCQQVIQ